MNQVTSEIFHQLESETQETNDKMAQLSIAVEEFVKLNGSGDGVRRKLRKSLEKRFCITCKKSQKAV